MNKDPDRRKIIIFNLFSHLHRPDPTLSLTFNLSHLHRPDPDRRPSTLHSFCNIGERYKITQTHSFVLILLPCTTTQLSTVTTFFFPPSTHISNPPTNIENPNFQRGDYGFMGVFEKKKNKVIIEEGYLIGRLVEASNWEAEDKETS
uniref:Uncharacterized protein n=1 Tax=Helianthus annuus TaxID=4232 RepID=A0A251U9W7_HELAN